jgi:hypothetical protein
MMYDEVMKAKLTAVAEFVVISLPSGEQHLRELPQIKALKSNLREKFEREKRT